MEKKLFLTIFLAILATASSIHAADNDSIILKSKASNQSLSLNRKLWEQSGLIQDMWGDVPVWEGGHIISLDAPYDQLEKIHTLLVFASKFTIDPLPKNPL